MDFGWQQLQSNAHTAITYFQMHKWRLILAVDCHHVVKRRKVSVILVCKMAKWNVQNISVSHFERGNGQFCEWF